MTTKQSYRLVTQSSGEVKQGLFHDWGKKFPHIAGHYESSFFYIIYQRVVDGNEGVRKSWWMILISLTGICGFTLAYLLCGMNPFLTTAFLIALSFLCGGGVIGVITCKPDYWDQLEVEKYTTTVCNLLWKLMDYEIISYEDGSSPHIVSPDHGIKRILSGNNPQELVARVDSMLVHLAFKVRKLEIDKCEGDPQLLAARNEREAIHRQAFDLSLAEKNPHTYFDRAIPAAEKAAKAPAVAS